MDGRPIEVAPPAHPTFRLASKVLPHPLLLGLLVGLLLLVFAGNVFTVGDETSYVEDARLILRTGSYSDVWPPGYVGVIALFLRLFGEESLFPVRLFQVLCAPLVGFFIIQLAHMLFGYRAALFSGYAWALYLPLAFFTHRLWPEIITLLLFVPSIYLLACYLQPTSPRAGRPGLLVVSGALFGLSLYLKEGHTYLAVFLFLLILLGGRGRRRHALAYLGAILIVLLPLAIRNYFHYDRFVLVGATVGKNIQSGLNAGYLNHDYNHDPDLLGRVHLNPGGTWDFVARNFLAYGPGWAPSDEPHVIDRTRADMRRAFEYAMEYKAAFLRTRIKKLADLFTPLSFAVRDLRPWIYPGALSAKEVRRPLIVISLAEVMLLLPLGLVNLIRLRHERKMFLLFLSIILYTALTGMLVSMSRYRLPMIPFLLVLAGAAVTRAPKECRGRVTIAWSALLIMVLLLLWALVFEEVVALVRVVWG